MGAKLRLDHISSPGQGDIKHAVWLMRLSYLRYALKATSDPRRVLDEYGEELQLSLNTNRSRSICSARSRSVATDSQRRGLSFSAQRSPERLKDAHTTTSRSAAHFGRGIDRSLLRLRPGPNTWPPAAHALAIRFVVRTELPPQCRLLIQEHEQMYTEGYDCHGGNRSWIRVSEDDPESNPSGR